jgi:amidohydrolase
MKRAVLSVILAAVISLSIGHTVLCQSGRKRAVVLDTVQAEISDRLVAKVIAWRHDIHQHPELGNHEVRTAGIVAEHLRGLGLEVRTRVANTGVVGILRGDRPGPVVALRADMDALPVTEELDVPYKSTVRTEYGGQQVGVMHACGHDAHTAILMGAAEVLAGMKATLAGTVVFIFQPAEEGTAGEDGGAEVMVREGVLDNPKVEAIFGLHVRPFESGGIFVRPGGAMAGGDTVRIVVHGRQTHGALPWDGVDPIVVASQIVLGLQPIVSRQSNITVAPVVLTIGIIRGGNRTNIIPDEVRLEGTLRTFDQGMRADIQERVRRTATGIAQAAGATASVEFIAGNLITRNDPALTARMIPTLRKAAAGPFDPNAPVWMASEDFSQYQQKVPGVFFHLGVTPKGVDPKTAEPNHSPRFFVDDAALVTGVRAMVNLVVDYAATAR